MHVLPLPDSSAIDTHASAPVHDLRRVSIHPGHWYPLAWSNEVRQGKSVGVHFAGDPIVLV